MSNPLDSLTPAAGAEALPLELLQPLDSNNPAATPVRLSGPEQRLTITPDPGVGDAALLPPSQLLISKDGMTRSIWPVHLAGWQSLGWQLLSPTSTGGSAAELLLEADPPLAPAEPESPVAANEASTELEPTTEPQLEAEPAPADEPTQVSTVGGEALLASEPTDFPAMTKAQIVEFCSTVYGVELDGSQTKAELVEQAMALEAQTSGSSTATSDGTIDASSDPADLAALELGDALL